MGHALATASPNISYQQGGNSASSIPFGSRFAAYRDTRPGGTGSYSASSSPQFRPNHPSEQVSDLQQQNGGSPNGYPRPRMGPLGQQRQGYQSHGDAGAAGGVADAYANPRGRSVHGHSADMGISAPNRTYNDHEATHGNAGPLGPPLYSTGPRMVSHVPDAAYNSAPLTPRRSTTIENYGDRSNGVSVRADRPGLEPDRRSSDFARTVVVGGDFERSRPMQLSEDLASLIKEREKLRSQAQAQLDATNTYNPPPPPEPPKLDHPRPGVQGKEIDNELLRTQLEEASNRYHVLQRSLRVLEEQSTAAAVKHDTTSKKLKDAEANASSLQKHQTILARENQLLKEQLGMLRHDTDQLKAHNSHGLDMSEQYHASQARLRQQEDYLKEQQVRLNTDSVEFAKLRRTLERMAGTVDDRGRSRRVFSAWKSRWYGQVEGLSAIIFRGQVSLLKECFDAMARETLGVASDRRQQLERSNLSVSSDLRLKALLSELEHTKEAHRQNVESLRNDFSRALDACRNEGSLLKETAEGLQVPRSLYPNSDW